MNTPQYPNKGELPAVGVHVLAKQSNNTYREMMLITYGDWKWRAHEGWLDNGSEPFWWVDMPVEFSEDTDHTNIKQNKDGSYTSYTDAGETVGTHGTYDVALDVWERRMGLK